MAGDCNENYLAVIPISTIPTLISPSTIDFMEDNPEFTSTLDSIMKSQSELAFGR